MYCGAFVVVRINDGPHFDTETHHANIQSRVCSMCCHCCCNEWAESPYHYYY